MDSSCAPDVTCGTAAMPLSKAGLELPSPARYARSSSRSRIDLELMDIKKIIPVRSRWVRMVRWITVTALALCLAGGSQGSQGPQGPQSSWPAFVSVPRSPRLPLGPLHASVGEAVEEALRGSTFPPPDWLRLSTVASEDAAQRVSRAVLAISEGLRLEETPVERLRRDTTQSLVNLALWVPPRSMLLVSSMIGEAVGDEPMILVENLDLDGEAEFFLGELTGPAEELRSLATKMLEKRCVAVVDLGEAGTATIHTTASGKASVESLISTASSISTSWSAVGGNSEYLTWIASEVSND